MKVKKNFFKLYLMKDKLLKKIENQNILIKKWKKIVKKEKKEKKIKKN